MKQTPNITTRPKKSRAKTNGPRTNLELPPTPGAVVLRVKVIGADTEAGRGGAPNNQGKTLQVRG